MEGAFRVVQLYARDGRVVALAKVDPFVAAEVRRFRWTLDSGGYAIGRPTGDGRPERLHRFLLGLQPGDPRVGDHIDGNRLDNRYSNLRVLSLAANAQNTSSRGASSSYRGVSWDTRSGLWVAQARVDGRHRHVGSFDDELAAAEAAEAFRLEHMPAAVAGR